MGTNYYVVKNKCECCNRYDEEYHIGKASDGWAFTFQGYPWNKLTSWTQWKEFLKMQLIYDEYGKQINYDWFVTMVETYKSPGYKNENGRQNKNHNDAGRTDKYPWFDPETDWDDEDGYSFTTKEFS